MAQQLFSLGLEYGQDDGTRNLLSNTPNRVPDDATAATGGTDVRRIEEQAVHFVVIVPRRRPIVTVATLTVRGATAEPASERKTKVSLERSRTSSIRADGVGVS